ncbi:phosphoglycerol transferase I [Dorea longicatena]|uniref:Phosphoglycerol transferase I n=1 Tax=Dorea longicatena TaxID=88431 RepID=A0A564ULT5_9FIRM|nr:GBS Bsp-like repeat-containing protein [Dorea longicatena]VUX20339.1 phosphoglycerol transferase I [Dorea longicatena]
MKKKRKIILVVGLILSTILALLASLLAFSAKWMFKTWTNLTMDELVYHLTAPLEGTNTDMIKDYCNECAVPVILILGFILFAIAANRKHAGILKKIAIVCSAGAVAVTGITVGVTWNGLDVSNYMKGQSTYSTFIDDNYVDPSSVNITFPEQKRNLIYIFLESMEMTYADKENGGAFKQNVIPELTQLAQENEDFSGKSNKLNGGYSMPGTTWTMGAMFGQTSGLPLNISIDGNSMDTQDLFFPGITTLGDILQNEGYSQTLLIGSEATFGGRKLYFTDHGQYDIMDYNYAHDNGLIPEDYKVWWGYEDEKLFGFAKEKLLELAQQDNPFNLTMLTVDTHFEDGYVCDICPDTFGDNQYANVMACSSRQVKEFVDWVQQQDFAADTTIVISGDHPTMDSDFCEDVDKDYERRVYTTYINADAEKQTEKKRKYTVFDDFPTTLSAMGAQIEGDRLGLGTNLFSAKETLSEKEGVTAEYNKMLKKSKLMEKLSDIDEEEYRRKEEEKVSPTADVKIKKTGKDNQVLIKVENIEHLKKGLQSITAAVWKNEDQSDLQWVNLAVFENGICKTKVDLSNYEPMQGEYNVHIYIIDGKGDAHNVAGTTFEIK